MSGAEKGLLAYQPEVFKPFGGVCCPYGQKEKPMKRFVKTIGVGLVVLWMASLLGSAASAKDPSQPAGQPPFGVAAHGDGVGTKLNGVVFIGFFDLDNNVEGSAIVVLRLRKGSALKIFYGEIGPMSPLNITAVQAAIQNVMEPQVRDAFFPGSNVEIKLVGLDEFMSKTVLGSSIVGDAIVDLSDITVAAK